WTNRVALNQAAARPTKPRQGTRQRPATRQRLAAGPIRSGWKRSRSDRGRTRSSRQTHARRSIIISVNAHRRPINFAQSILGKDLAGCPLGDEVAVVQQRELSAIHRREIQVMRDGEYRDPRAVAIEVLEQPKRLALKPQVEICSRLVEQ